MFEYTSNKKLKKEIQIFKAEIVNKTLRTSLLLNAYHQYDIQLMCSVLLVMYRGKIPFAVVSTNNTVLP